MDADSHVTSYGYDTNGDLTSVTPPLGRQTQWGYKGLGVKTSRTDALGRLTTYTLDGWNRVTTVTYPDSSTKTVSYDANSNVTGFTDGTGTTSRTYDAANRLTSLTNKNSSATVLSSFGHGYNSDDKRTSCTEATGDVVSYGYDRLLHLSSESRTGTNAYTALYVVDGVGNRTSSTVGG